MNVVTLIIAAITPFLASNLLFGVPGTPGVLIPLLERSFYFALVPVLWRLTLLASEIFIRNRPSGKQSALIFSGTGLVLLMICSLLALQMIKFRFPPLFFYMILATIGIESLAVVLHKRKSPYLSLIVLILSDTLIAECSFLLIGTHGWQSLLFSSALAVQICAYRLSALLSGHRSRLLGFSSDMPTGSPSIPVWGQKFYLFSLIGGILIISLMSMMGELHPAYLALYLALPVVIPLADAFRKHPLKAAEIQGFHAKNSGILLFVIVIIAALTQLLQNT